MNAQPLDAGVGDMPMVVKWDISHHLMFVLEVDLEALEAVVPAPLTPVEVRPDRGLMSIAVLKYHPGHFGRPDYPVFDEIVAVVGVGPNLALDMPMPRFSFYALDIFSDSIEFVEGEAAGVYTPTALDPSLRVSFSEDGLSARAEDDEGPIAEFANTSPRAPRYRHAGFFGQHYNDTRPQMYCGPWHWEGDLWEHQHRGRAWGRVHPHRFFKGLDTSRVRGCWLQMFARPDTHSYERFYQVRAFGPR